MPSSSRILRKHSAGSRLLAGLGFEALATKSSGSPTLCNGSKEGLARRGDRALPPTFCGEPTCRSAQIGELLRGMIGRGPPRSSCGGAKLRREYAWLSKMIPGLVHMKVHIAHVKTIEMCLDLFGHQAYRAAVRKRSPGICEAFISSHFQRISGTTNTATSHSPRDFLEKGNLYVLQCHQGCLQTLFGYS